MSFKPLDALSYNKKVWILISITTFVRLIIAGNLELGNDEVYYQTYAQYLQWNYFDHPPMVALLIRLSTFNLYFHQELFTRLGPVLCSVLGTRLIFKIGKRLDHERTGWIAAILYNTSFYNSVVAGTFILPDSPLVLFWLLSIYFMIIILDDQVNPTNRGLRFILLGISIGLCIMSKIHGIFLWFGFGGYILFRRRKLLNSPMLWISLIISIAIFSPIYIWNLQNNFISYKYHQGRINFWGNNPDIGHFLQQILGSVFYSNPVNFIIYVCMLWTILKRRKERFPELYPLLLWLALPLIIILFWSSIFSETLPHWSGPAFLSLMLLGACWLNKLHFPQRYAWLKASIWVYGSVILIAVTSIRILPFRIGSIQKRNLGKGDITLDMSGWHQFALRFDSIYKSDINTGRMERNAVILSDYWFPAAHLDYYLSNPFHHVLLAFGPLGNIHQFAWLNKHRPRLQTGSDAYFIYSSNYYGPPDPSLRNAFFLVEDSITIPQHRNLNIVRYFVIYRMHHFKGDSLNYLIPGIQ